MYQEVFDSNLASAMSSLTVPFHAELLQSKPTGLDLLPSPLVKTGGRILFSPPKKTMLGIRDPCRQKLLGQGL